MRIVCGVTAPMSFSDPHRVLRPLDVASALDALRACEDALHDGYWIAGLLTYELGTLFHGRSAPADGTPLLRLGIFDAPKPYEPCAPKSSALSALCSRVSHSSYERAIASIHRAIYDGEVYQVNYTVPFGFSFAGDPESLWHRIARTTGAAYQVYLHDDDMHVLSWSPELFLAFDGSGIVTKPMKGTAALEAAADLKSGKNRAEHIMIVDLLRNDLQRVANDVQVDDLATIERYPTFLTMTSTIRANVRTGMTFEDILRAAFPCGSVTGAPKRAAIETIAVHEGARRGVYCGSIGYLSPERRGWWNVAIRTATLTGSHGDFHVGGGIVADSDATGEWNEIRIKSSFLRSHAAPLVLLETMASNATAQTRAAHLDRLARSAAIFDVTYDADDLARQVTEACDGTILRILRLRIDADGTISVAGEPLHATPQPLAICLATQCVDRHDPLLQHKTAWRPLHDAALRDAQRNGCFDALLQNAEGELTEGARTNLFVEQGGMLFTPPLESGVLPGILRAQLLLEGRAREQTLTSRDLVHADRIFIGNSARGLMRASVVQ